MTILINPPNEHHVLFLSPEVKLDLPDPKLIVEKFLLRRKFRPDPQGTNLMFAFFAQHFTHQFFKTNNRMGLGFTKALGHGVRDAGANRNESISGA